MNDPTRSVDEATIEAVTAREILDNRLEPTIRVTVRTATGHATADVPCGRSRGDAEALDRRDGGDRYHGRGVSEAVENITDPIAPELIGRDVTQQSAIDELLIDLDGTENKTDLGGNAITGVSLAVLKAGAVASDLPLYRYVGGVDATSLPIPFFDLIEGGALSGSDLDFQEHQIVPVGADSFSEAIRWSAEVYYELGDILEANYGSASRNVGDEGGYNPPGVDDPRNAFDLLLQAIDECGYAGEFRLAADVAASQFYDAATDTYDFLGERKTREELVQFYEDLVESYPVISIEDPLQEADFEGFAAVTDRVDAQIIGDDLFVTNPDRVVRGVERGSANALLLKVNQVGTVTEALSAAAHAVHSGYAVQVSERSGQTADTWLADLAVGTNAGQIKTGVSRSERTEQYNRLLAIEAELGESASYGLETGTTLTDWT